MNVTVTGDAAAKLRTLLQEESADSVVRVRETKIGIACKSKLILVLSIDERESDDVETVVDSLPFVINKDLLDQYGENFAVALDERQVPSVTAPGCTRPQGQCCAS